MSASPSPHTTTDSSPPPPAPPSDTDQPTPNNHTCLWIDCTKSLPDPEALYNHLCNDHIGRKSTNNLCLTCKWKDCGTTCAKRDHITSHLRVHTPLKPHTCEICKKSFKRPQDLKKHEKIHTEEHHAQHKHSKAVTVPDPLAARRRESLSIDNSDHIRSQDYARHHNARSRSMSSHPSLAHHHPGILPTPSPEIIHPQVYPHHHLSQQPSDPRFLQNQLPTWEALRPDGTATQSTGSKRAHDAYAVDDFFADVKKRRVNPSYDSSMAERLSNLAYIQNMAGAGTEDITGFNPRSVSLDIRSPEELAAVNQFLLTLGRDVEAGVHPRHTSHTVNSSAYSPYQNYFDHAQLAQLGLAGMPGIPSPYPHESQAAFAQNAAPNPYQSNAFYPAPSTSRLSHPPASAPQYGQMYPSVHDLAASAYGGNPHHGNAYDRRLSTHGSHGLAPLVHGSALNASFPSAASYQSPASHLHPTPPLEMSSSPHSSLSSPSNSTPPHLSAAELGAYEPQLRIARGVPPPAHLAPVDYTSKAMRTIVPLKSVPAAERASAPVPARAPPPPSSSQRPREGAPAAAASSAGDTLYPFLTSGDSDLKLPPLQHRFRSPSPSPVPSSAALPRSPPAHSHSPPPKLPSLRSITTPAGAAAAAASSPSSRPSSSSSAVGAGAEDRLARSVGRLQLGRDREEPGGAIGPEHRRRHAALIRDLLIMINGRYKEYAQRPSVAVADAGVRRAASPGLSPRDVEMAVV